MCSRTFPFLSGPLHHPSPSSHGYLHPCLFSGPGPQPTCPCSLHSISPSAMCLASSRTSARTRRASHTASVSNMRTSHSGLSEHGGRRTSPTGRQGPPGPIPQGHVEAPRQGPHAQVFGLGFLQSQTTQTISTKQQTHPYCSAEETKASKVQPELTP